MLRVGRPEDTVSTLCVGMFADAHYPYAGWMAESYDSNAPAIMETEHPSAVRNLGEAKDTVAFRRGGIARSSWAASAPCLACRCCATASHRRSGPGALRGAAVHRQTDRAGDDLRGSGGHCDRERSAVRRNPREEPTAPAGQRAQVAVRIKRQP